MNLLIALLFSRTIKRTLNPKHLRKGIRREAKFWATFFTELVQAVQRLSKFIVKKVKYFRKGKPVEEVKLPTNVINFNDYKLKKAN